MFWRDILGTAQMVTDVKSELEDINKKQIIDKWTIEKYKMDNTTSTQDREKHTNNDDGDKDWKE